MTYKMILVGYDGSENAKRALGRAVQLAKTDDSSPELRIVVVADTGGHALFQPDRATAETRNTLESAKNLLSDAIYTSKEGGVSQPYGSVEEGHPASMILTLASEYKADLIVVGRRGVRGLQRFLMGSVSSAVISNALCDVLVVK